MPIVNVNNINIHYKIIGHKNADTILFIHGLGSDTQDWEKQISFFKKDYQILTLDLRGHGKSDKPNISYNITLFSQDIIALIKELKISSVHIVGISLGGMIALQLAIDNPRLMKTMTIVNAIPEFSFINHKERMMFFMRISMVKFLGMKITAKFLSKKLFPKKEQEILRKNFIEKWQKNDKRIYYNILKGLLGWGVKKDLHIINCPTLFIASEYDYTSLARKKKYVDQISNAKLTVIKDTRHAVPVEKSAEFNKVLYSFLKFIKVNK